jgi:hypothetical protein
MTYNLNNSNEKIALFVKTLLSEIPNSKLIFVKPRQTRLGSVCYSKELNKFLIKINNNLDQFSFLYVFLHEYAHILTLKNSKKLPRPHGKLWQQNYFNLLQLAINENLFPDVIANKIKIHLINPQIFSYQRNFKIMDEIDNYLNKEKKLFLKDLLPGETFTYKNKTYKVLKKIRTRYLCMESSTRKMYYISGFLKIK